VADIKVLLFDIGRVLLTNGWDRHSRQRACEHFGLDWEDFQDRHEFVSGDFETGKLTLEQYLRRTVFYRDRPFSEEGFVAFMKAESEPYADSLNLVGELAASGRYVLATLNNESRELNEHRIETFGLRDHFTMFLSSCYLGVKKPDEGIYAMAVSITQYRPEECVFIDDRELNLECANLAGIRPNALSRRQPTAHLARRARCHT
jgi:putative hydrolase of the HAD superfamily